MKLEWKKAEKQYYGVKDIPMDVRMPKQNFIMISGSGNPNEEDFSNRVSVLYGLAYAIKMQYKKSGLSIDGIDDFGVYPLEGIWQNGEQDGGLNKSQLIYTIMIQQPHIITKEMVDSALASLKQKKPSPLLDEVRFSSIEEGHCVQILHIGSYDDEPQSFAKLDEFVASKGWKRKNDTHREIYLSNANRVVIGKRKTILRYEVE